MRLWSQVFWSQSVYFIIVGYNGIGCTTKYHRNLTWELQAQLSKIKGGIERGKPFYHKAPFLVLMPLQESTNAPIKLLYFCLGKNLELCWTFLYLIYSINHLSITYLSHEKGFKPYWPLCYSLNRLNMLLPFKLFVISVLLMVGALKSLNMALRSDQGLRQMVWSGCHFFNTL